MICNNASSMGYRIIDPQCFKHPATKKITVKYNEGEQDTLELCEDCASALIQDARPRGYTVISRNL